MLHQADLPVPTMPLKLADLLNNEVEHAANGLLTPILSDRMSPHTDDETPAIVAAAQMDLRRSTLARRFPNMDWDEVVRILENTKLPRRLTRPEVQLIVHEWLRPNGINHVLLQKECFMREPRTIHARVAALEDMYGSMREVLGEAVIAAFETCYEAGTYLLSDYEMLLPNMDPDTIRQVVNDYCPHRPRWLQRETEFVAACVADGEPIQLIERNLVFRKPPEVALRVDAARKRYQREMEERENEKKEREREEKKQMENGTMVTMLGDTENGLSLEENGTNTDPLTTRDGLVETNNVVTAKDKILRGQKRKADESDEELSDSNLDQYTDTDSGSEFESPNFKAQPSQRATTQRSATQRNYTPPTPAIAEYIHTDMTATGLVEQKLSESAVRRALAGMETVPFTSMENKVIRECVTNGTTDMLLELLPFRTPDEITEKCKRIEIAGQRKRRFANDIERLVYEAQWYVSMDTRSLRRRRMVDLASAQAEVQRRTEQQERRRREREEKRERMKLEVLQVLEVLEMLEILAAQAEIVLELDKALLKEHLKASGKRGRGRPRIVKRRRPERRLRPREKPPAKPSSRMAALLADAEWFQSVTGDGSMVEEGEKRRRYPVDEPRRLVEEAPPKPRRRPRRTTRSQPARISPYDPPSYLQDTMVPFKGRRFFNETISNHLARPAPIAFSDDVLDMLQAGPYVPINNTVAARVVRDHAKLYRLLHGLFPPLEDPRNIVHVRYLLYPHHTEQFVLAAPKSNELDPVAELQRIFEIHHALYFLRSAVVRDIIHNDYCVPLGKAADAGDFSEFMMVVDRWNTLMLELLPYAIEVDPTIDINGAARTYLPDSYLFEPSVLDLKLDTFYCEVLAVGKRTLPLDLIVDRYKTRYRHLRPVNYTAAFIALINTKRNISRYALHLLLLRAYTRIVSPDSRKLRCYKAFTAEVYGELLPLFVSEVLTKVGLKPTDRFYDLGSGVGNTTLQAALEFGVADSGGCEVMEHASKLTLLQEHFMQKQLQVLGMRPLPLLFALNQSFVANDEVRAKCVDCNILIVNNYLFDFALNAEVGRLLYGLKPGSKIISLRNFIPPRYKAGTDKTVLDYLKVEKFEMSENLSVSWTANKVPYYILTVCLTVRQEYL